MTDIEPRLTSLEILRRDIAPNAPDEALEYFSKVCRRLRLDPWRDEITLVGRYDSRVKDLVWRPQVTVAGRRAIAERTGKLAGIEGPEWCGPRRYDDNGLRLPLDWTEVWDDDDAYPYAARVLVYRHDWDRPANGTVKWAEFAQYTTVNGQTRLTAAWQKMRSHMLGKVAESLALRRAFSEVAAAVDYVGDDDQAAIAEAEAELVDRVPDHVYDATPESRGAGVEHAFRYEPPDDLGRPFPPDPNPGERFS